MTLKFRNKGHKSLQVKRSEVPANFHQTSFSVLMRDKTAPTGKQTTAHIGHSKILQLCENLNIS